MLNKLSKTFKFHDKVSTYIPVTLGPPQSSVIDGDEGLSAPLVVIFCSHMMKCSLQVYLYQYVTKNFDRNVGDVPQFRANLNLNQHDV